jgi:hypothetical protein
MVSASQCQAAITKSENAINRLPSVLEDLRQKFNKSIVAQIPLVGQGLQWLWNKIISLAGQVRDKVNEMLQNARVPFIFDDYVNKWIGIHEKIKNNSDGMAAVLQINVNHSGDFWGGDAGGAYKDGMSLQPGAADAIGGQAGSIASACESIRDAGYTFYITMAAAIALLIVALVTAEVPPAAIAALLAALVAIGVALAGLFIQVDTGKKSLKENKGGGSTFAEGWPKAKA